MTRSELLGIPENVQATVDVLLLAETRGPATLDRGLDTLTPEQTRAALKALLGRHNMRRARTVREAVESLGRAEVANERAKARRGGNR